MTRRFWSDNVQHLTPYVPGEQPQHRELVKLNTNEHPFGPSQKVKAAVVEAVNASLRLYPDPQSIALRQAIATYYQLPISTVFVGNGSDEVLAHIFHALFQQKKPILFPDITYSFYPVYCRLYQINYQQIPLREDLTLHIDDYKQDNGGIIFPNPNAPTGILLSLAEIKNLLRLQPDSVIVVDEAYIDFGGESAIQLVMDYPNLVVTQSFSKSRSLAGMRLGFAIAQPEIIAALTRVKDSFNSYPIDNLASAAGIAAMEDVAYFNQMQQYVIAERVRVTKALQALGFQQTNSAANFVFVHHPQYEAKDLASGLREQGVIVRHFQQPRIAQYLRITIGDESQNNRLLALLEQRLNE